MANKVLLFAALVICFNGPLTPVHCDDVLKLDGGFETVGQTRILKRGTRSDSQEQTDKTEAESTDESSDESTDGDDKKNGKSTKYCRKLLGKGKVTEDDENTLTDQSRTEESDEYDPEEWKQVINRLLELKDENKRARKLLKKVRQMFGKIQHCMEEQVGGDGSDGEDEDSWDEIIDDLKTYGPIEGLMKLMKTVKKGLKKVEKKLKASN